MIKKKFALKNTDIINSSSGGAFPTIIEAIKFELGKEKQLIVYGAAFNDKLDITYQRATTDSEYLKFRGSKYVRSEMGSTLKDIEKDLKNGNNVLFTGVPCQVFALKQFLNRKNVDMTNLYLVDLICHGTPGNKVWKDFVQWIERQYNSKLVEFSFRYSQARWNVYPVMAKFENGKIIVNGYKVRLFIKLFFTHLIMCKGCYSCKFSNLERNSDLTIGDFWGIETVMPEYPYKNGVNIVLVNTDNGEKIVNIINKLANKNKAIVISKCNSNDYLKFQTNLNHPTVKPEKFEEFWKDYESYGFEYVLKKYGDYNLIGRARHYVTRFLGETNMRPLLDKILAKLNIEL